MQTIGMRVPSCNSFVSRAKTNQTKSKKKKNNGHNGEKKSNECAFAATNSKSIYLDQEKIKVLFQGRFPLLQIVKHGLA